MNFRFILFNLFVCDICDGYRLLRMSLSNRISKAVQYKFRDAPVSRVLNCFDRFCQGTELDIMRGDGKSDHNRQKANCFVDGLTTATFHDKNNGKFPWASKLEQSGRIVASELKSFLESEAEKKNGEPEKWAGPRFVGEHYGPEWRTLGLQDRGLWDGENVDIFPKTVELLRSCKVPSQEAFFARQGPKSGIQPHSDLNNFILTAHLAIDVPEGRCWIQVGDDKYYWKNDDVSIFDTSIFHSTWNDGDSDRFVLLIRFWHPDLTEVEVEAFTLIFDMLDAVNEGDAALARFEAERVFGLKMSPTDKFININNNNSNNSEKGDLSPASSPSPPSASTSSPSQPLTRQQRRELEKKADKMDKKAASATSNLSPTSSFIIPPANSQTATSTSTSTKETASRFHRGK